MFELMTLVSLPDLSVEGSACGASLPHIVCTFGHKLMVLTGEGRLVEYLACFTRDKSGMTIDTGDEAAAVSRDRETRKWKKLGGDGMSWHLIWALESNNGFRTAEVEQQVRPITAVAFIVICKARFTRGQLWNAMCALDIVVAALGALRVYAKLV